MTELLAYIKEWSKMLLVKTTTKLNIYVTATLMTQIQERSCHLENVIRSNIITRDVYRNRCILGDDTNIVYETVRKVVVERTLTQN